jgi:hypothetical protein
MDSKKLARELVKIAKGLVAEDVANSDGVYEHFVGKIDYKGNKGIVTGSKPLIGNNRGGASFELKGGKVIFKRGNWENGTWKNGTWEGGIWKNGTWKSGVWENGTWENGTWKNGVWKNGYWHKGTWENGKFNRGVFLKGLWKNGVFDGQSFFQDSIWEDGLWKNGKFEGDVWKDGTFLKGYFESGTWEGGEWKGGVFDDKAVWKDKSNPKPVNSKKPQPKDPEPNYDFKLDKKEFLNDLKDSFYKIAGGNKTTEKISVDYGKSQVVAELKNNDGTLYMKLNSDKKGYLEVEFELKIENVGSWNKEQKYEIDVETDKVAKNAVGFILMTQKFDPS